MYIWKLKLEFLWSFAEVGDENYAEYTVAALNFAEACKKARELLLKEYIPFKDEEEPKKTHSIKEKSIEIYNVERTEWIDG